MVPEAVSKLLPIFSALIQKGGAGKTTVNLTFAEYCAVVMGKRVLLIDLDPQCNISRNLLSMEVDDNTEFFPPVHPEFNPNDPYDVANSNPRSSIADIYESKEVLPYETFFTQERYKGSIDIIPGWQSKLTNIETMFGAVIGSKDPKSVSGTQSYVKFAFQLSKFLRLPEIAERYDIVVIDAGPTDNIFFRGVIYSATHLICPYTGDEYALGGIATLMNVAKDPKRAIHGFNKLNFLGILPSNIVGSSNVAKGVIEANMKMYKDLHFPAGIMVKHSDSLKRKLQAIIPKQDNLNYSVFSDRPSKIKDHLLVFGAIYDRVFSDEKKDQVV